MEVETVAPLDVAVESDVVKFADVERRFRLVSAPKFVELRVAHINVVVVHEHHVTAFIDFGIFRVFGLEGNIARVIGNRGFQIIARCIVIIDQRIIKEDQPVFDIRDDPHLIFRGHIAFFFIPADVAVIMRARDDNRISDRPALGDPAHVDPGVTGHRIVNNLVV